MNIGLGHLLVPRWCLYRPELDSLTHAADTENDALPLKRIRLECDEPGASALIDTPCHSAPVLHQGHSFSPALHSVADLRISECVRVDFLTFPAFSAALREYVTQHQAHHRPHACGAEEEGGGEAVCDAPALAKASVTLWKDDKDNCRKGGYELWSFCVALGVRSDSDAHAVQNNNHQTLSLPRWIYVRDIDKRLYIFYENKRSTDSLSLHPQLHDTAKRPGIQIPLTSVYEKPLLLVGVGGIGCEVLKILVLSGFRHVEIIDLDTIDETNLNRQLLFTVDDVGQPKSVTAAAAVLKWFEGRHHRFSSLQRRGEECKGSNEQEWDTHIRAILTPPTLVAYHDNVKDPKFDAGFFSRFCVVLNALDNIAARQHVNRMCMKLGVPLIESGTMGYNGQVHPIVKGLYECYDCYPKPTVQKTFAICTVHARPTNMVHCVHFAKELYEALFGEKSLMRPEISEALLNSANNHVEDAPPHSTASAPTTLLESSGRSELVYLHGFLASWWSLASATASAAADNPAHAEAALGGSNGRVVEQLCCLGEQLLCCLYHDKIEELLVMKSSWPIAPPQPLSKEFFQRVCSSPEVACSVGVATRLCDAEEFSLTLKPISRDCVLGVEEAVGLFMRACAECAHRLLKCTARQSSSAAPGGRQSSLMEATGNGVSSSSDGFVGFSKDDDAAVDFVAAAANLRAHVFHIPEESVESLRTIAGAIVPAIATTNAIIAAGVVEQLVCLLRSKTFDAQRLEDRATRYLCRSIYVRQAPFLQQRQLLDLSKPHRRCFFMREGSAADEQHNPLAGVTCRSQRVMDSYLVRSIEPRPPNPACLVCQDRVPQVHVCLDLARISLRAFVKTVLEGRLQFAECSVVCNGRIVYEEGEYEELAECPLSCFAQPALQRPATPPGSEVRGLASGCAHGVPGKDAQPCYAPVVMLADAMNKELEWCVILEHCSSLTDTAFFCDASDACCHVRGLERAKACETATLAWLREKKMREEKEKDVDMKVEALSSTAPGGKIGAVAEDAIDVDEDVGAVEDVAQEVTGTEVVEID